MTNIKFSELSPVVALSDGDIFALTQTQEDGSKASRSVALKNLSEFIAGTATAYRGTWQSDSTYHQNDMVSETVNGIPGLFICLAETSSAEPSGSGDWRRIAGVASAIDGLAASSSSGNLVYNTTQDVTTDTITPQFSGEASKTFNISSSTTVDLTLFTNLLFNTNPAAIIRLAVNPIDTATITFTNSDNYWLPDGTYSTDAPVFDLDSTQPLTVIEVTNVTVAGAPGVLVRQVYPVAATGGSDVYIPALGAPGASAMAWKASATEAFAAGDVVPASALEYGGVMDAGSGVIGFITLTGGTWELRGYFPRSDVAAHGVSLVTRIDGTSLMSSTHLLQATTASDRIRNCRYSAEDNSMIDCEVLVGGKWYPFTASPADSTKWGPAIYNAAAAGKFGEVIPYVPEGDAS